MGPESFKQQVASVLEQTIKGEFEIRWNEPLAASDHWPFYEEGIPVVLLIFWPDENYHQSGDRYEKVENDKIEKTAKVGTAIVERLTGLK